MILNHAASRCETLFNRARSASHTARDKLPENVAKWNEKYEQIETSCRVKYHCTPCTYPNCQRQVRLKKNLAKTFGKA